MWFDYQALFDQSKNWLLHYDFKMQELVTMPIKHTDLKTNTLDRKVLLGDKIDNNLINNICSRFDPAIGKVLDNLTKHIVEHGHDYSQDNYDILLHNLKFLLTICLQFSYSSN